MKDKIYYVLNDLPYVEEKELYDCGCGGKPIVDFCFKNGKFKETEIHCNKCGISTGVKETIDEAIEIWQKCFETNDYHNKFCYFNHDDDHALGGFASERGF